jgi:single-stranded DNA-specific DHH superfamily exonuclease
MSNINSDTVILSDEDCDGMMATRIVHNALTTAYPKSTHKIIWQDWDVFGLKDGDIQSILNKNPRTAYILDIGSGTDILYQIGTLLTANVNVVILDNHPPDILVEGDKSMEEYGALLSGLRKTYPFPPVEAFPYPYFFYKSSTDNCTTGIAYNFCRNLSLPLTNMEKWALLGLIGDVASDSKEGGPLFKELMERHPHLKGLLASTAIGSKFNWGLIDFYAQMFHVPRRMIYNDAPAICYAAMKEMEQMSSWLELYAYINKGDLAALGDFPLFADGKNSATQYLVRLHIDWREKHKIVEDWVNNTQLDFPDFGVTIVRHEWNLGSALANKLSSGKHKTWFVINDIPNWGIHVSGRGGKDGKLHIGKVFRSCDPGIMKGGGLKPAGSANAQVQSAELVLDELIKGVERSKA